MLLEEYLDVYYEMRALKARADELKGRLLKDMLAEGVDARVSKRGQVTVVRPQKIEYDAAKLKAYAAPEVAARAVVEVVDKAELEKCAKDGLVSPELLDEVSTITDRNPYLRVG